jgi:transcriptional regulator with XRE-family HTH domain
LGWTQEAAALRAGMTRKTWGRIESGRPVRTGSLRRLEAAFDVPLGTLAPALRGESTVQAALAAASKRSLPPDVPEPTIRVGWLDDQVILHVETEHVNVQLSVSAATADRIRADLATAMPLRASLSEVLS